MRITRERAARGGTKTKMAMFAEIKGILRMYSLNL